MNNTNNISRKVNEKIASMQKVNLYNNKSRKNYYFCTINNNNDTISIKLWLNRTMFSKR